MIAGSQGRAEPTTIFHLFLKDKEIGRLAISGQYSTETGHIPSNIRKKLNNHLDITRSTSAHKQVGEFLIDEGELAYRVVTEILEPSPSLYVFGAGHVGQAVALIGALAGYIVTVVDDRKEFLTPERFPNPHIVLVNEDYDRVSCRVEITRNSAVVIVTRGHQYDETCLRQVLAVNTRYVGMIGSRRRVIAIFQRLVKEGISEELLGKVHAPIGLEIGAVSPQEIAIAIMAEIIDVMNGFKQSHNHKRRLPK